MNIMGGYIFLQDLAEIPIEIIYGSDTRIVKNAKKYEK